METICKRCKKKPIYNKTRRLCCSCYHKVRRQLIKAGVPIRKTALQKRRTVVVNLREKYGVQILKDINAVDTKHFWNLTSVANKYDVSREYIRQCYTKIKGRPYRAMRHEKVTERKNEDGCSLDPRHKVAEYQQDSPAFKGAVAELLFLNKCKEMGFDISFCCNGTVDLKVNGLFVDVKSCSTPFLRKGSITEMYRYLCKGRQTVLANFFACYHPTEKAFFIIPAGQTTKDKSGAISILISKHITHYRASKNRYWKFKDSWDLLEYRSIAELYE